MDKSEFDELHKLYCVIKELLDKETLKGIVEVVDSVPKESSIVVKDGLRFLIRHKHISNCGHDDIRDSLIKLNNSILDSGKGLKIKDDVFIRDNGTYRVDFIPALPKDRLPFPTPGELTDSSMKKAIEVLGGEDILPHLVKLVEPFKLTLDNVLEELKDAVTVKERDLNFDLLDCLKRIIECVEENNRGLKYISNEKETNDTTK